MKKVINFTQPVSLTYIAISHGSMQSIVPCGVVPRITVGSCDARSFINLASPVMAAFRTPPSIGVPSDEPVEAASSAT